MKDEKHNGWTNYETWLTALWLSEWHLTAADFLADDEIEEAAHAETEYEYMRVCGRLYERIRKQVEEFAEQENACTGLFSDLLNAALSRVDWYDIANNWLSNLVEEVKRNA